MYTLFSLENPEHLLPSYPRRLFSHWWDHIVDVTKTNNSERPTEIRIAMKSETKTIDKMRINPKR